MKAKKKYIYGPSMMIVIFLLTCKVLFSGQKLSEVIKDIRDASGIWLIAGAAAAVLFVACESCIIWYMLRVMNRKTKFLSCLKYSFIGFFFSYITPSSSGGQPAQMYYMKKDGIKLGTSGMIMLLITISYKSVLLILGAIFIILGYDMIHTQANGILWLHIVGAILNIAFIALLIIMLRRPEKVRNTGIGTVDLLFKKKIIKDNDHARITDRINCICDNYILSADRLCENKKHMIIVYFITVIQRLLLFSVTWIVYRSYGLSSVSFIDIIALQTVIAVATEMLPLPGASGITEGCFYIVFERIFTASLVRPSLIISRGLSFYLILILGGAVTLSVKIHDIYSRKHIREKNNSRFAGLAK